MRFALWLLKYLSYRRSIRELIKIADKKMPQCKYFVCIIGEMKKIHYDCIFTVMDNRGAHFIIDKSIITKLLRQKMHCIKVFINIIYKFYKYATCTKITWCVILLPHNKCFSASERKRLIEASETVIRANETVIEASERGIAVGRENSRIEPFLARCYSPLTRSYYCPARSY